MQRYKKSQPQCKLNLVTSELFQESERENSKEEKPTAHNIEKANCDGMCSDKKLAPISLGGDSSDRTTISVYSKINRRYLKMM